MASEQNEIDVIVQQLQQQQQQPAPKKAASKRRRAAPAPKKIGDGVNIIGENFIDSYSGHLCKRGIFIPGVDAVFACIPTAFRWLMDNVTDDATREDYAKALCTAYDQAPGTIAPSRERAMLVDFGGNMLFPEWNAINTAWDTHAATAGATVKEYKSTAGGKRAAKRGRNGIVFESGAYSIPYKGKSCKKVNAIEGGKIEKEQLTVSRARKKVDAFAKAHQTDLKCGVTVFFKDGYDIVTCASYEAIPPELVNNISVQLTGDGKCVGPAYAVFTKKHSVAL